jgi:hypothetical protein
MLSRVRSPGPEPWTRTTARKGPGPRGVRSVAASRTSLFRKATSRSTKMRVLTVRRSAWPASQTVRLAMALPVSRTLLAIRRSR